MIHKTKLLIYLLSFIVTSAYAQSKFPNRDVNRKINCNWLVKANGDLSAVILHDIFSPPVASRIYVYSNIAAYEAMIPFQHTYKSYSNRISELPVLPQPLNDKKYNYSLCGLRAFYSVSKALIFSEDFMEESWNELMKTFPKNESTEEEILNSIEYGNEIASAIIRWAKKDHYIETRTYPRFQPAGKNEFWEPTPPDYAEGLEPYWSKIRTLVIDSAAQFAAPNPPSYNVDPNSEFMKMVQLVYDSSKFIASDSQRIAISKYWDDNPFTTVHEGHFSFSIKKVTPAGHWMGIASIALQKTNADIIKAAFTYSLVSISIFDAIISCWNLKYTTNYIRPVTIINRVLDPEWKPIIQTPPFPEYTSGHGVISGAASNTLSKIFGEQFQFTDTLELLNDLDKQEFKSFRIAAHQATLSRYYGGIHYYSTALRSVEQGNAVSDYVLSKLYIP